VRTPPSPPGPHGGGGGGPHGLGGPHSPPTAAAVGGGRHGSGGPTTAGPIAAAGLAIVTNFIFICLFLYPPLPYPPDLFETGGGCIGFLIVLWVDLHSKNNAQQLFSLEALAIQNIHMCI